jgi:polygalacturonase
MCFRRALIFAVSLFSGCVASLWAQDSRPLIEPPFPATCIVLHATVQSTEAGPVIGESAIEQNAESAAESQLLIEALDHCGPYKAVELALGADSSYNAFLLNPLTLPQSISLIIDGGVTVFASRDPRNYQDSTPAVCGTYGPPPTYGVDLGCRAFITMDGNSGVYGYGVIDGQGQKPFIFYQSFPDAIAPPEPYSWWDLTLQKDASQGGKNNCPAASCEQASPVVISGGTVVAGLNENLVLYKITIRNPPYHTVKLGGTNATVWGVKVQAPWNVPNTDGFDIHTSNATVYDSTVANGDQEIALGSTNGPTRNITVDHFNGYSKGGITILGSGTAVSNILIQNVNITGDLPSVVVNGSVNGMSVTELNQLYGIKTYGQALPNATNDLKAIQITDSSQLNTTKPGANISAVTFKSFCIQDIIKPINIDFTGKDKLPNLQNATFQDIHILAPTSQFPDMKKGIPTGNPGGYQLSFVTQVAANASMTNPNQFTLDNVVLDDYAPNATGVVTSSISSIDAEVNTITTATNIYPMVLNGLSAGGPNPTVVAGPPKQTLLLNTYPSSTTVSSPALAYSCPTGPMPFITGDLYLSLGSTPGGATNLQTVSVSAGQSVTLNAVVQPTMSQTTNFIANSYGASPGLVAVGSPALTNPIIFYEGSIPIGSGNLSANGTLATLVLNKISAGSHTYSAQYQADRFYAELNFGSVTVRVRPRWRRRRDDPVQPGHAQSAQSRF